jgi:hypothetical protein
LTLLKSIVWVGCGSILLGRGGRRAGSCKRRGEAVGYWLPWVWGRTCIYIFYFCFLLFQLPIIGGNTPKSPQGICFFLFRVPTPKRVGPFGGLDPKSLGERKNKGCKVKRMVYPWSLQHPKNLGVGNCQRWSLMWPGVDGVLGLTITAEAANRN